MFDLNDVEKERRDKFVDKHRESCGPIDSLGLRRTCISYIFTPTGVGSMIQVRCDFCRDYEDITDIESW